MCPLCRLPCLPLRPSRHIPRPTSRSLSPAGPVPFAKTPPVWCSRRRNSAPLLCSFAPAPPAIYFVIAARWLVSGGPRPPSRVRGWTRPPTAAPGRRFPSRPCPGSTLRLHSCPARQATLTRPHPAARMYLEVRRRALQRASKSFSCSLRHRFLHLKAHFCSFLLLEVPSSVPQGTLTVLNFLFEPLLLMLRSCFHDRQSRVVAAPGQGQTSREW